MFLFPYLCTDVKYRKCSLQPVFTQYILHSLKTRWWLWLVFTASGYFSCSVSVTQHNSKIQLLYLCNAGKDYQDWDHKDQNIATFWQQKKRNCIPFSFLLSSTAILLKWKQWGWNDWQLCCYVIHCCNLYKARRTGCQHMLHSFCDLHVH